jgi:outer membrane protein OmpA-like peptidoglycan-associated protein
VYAKQDAQTDSLVKSLAKSNLELKRLQKEQQSKLSGKKNKKSKDDKRDATVNVKDEEVGNEMERIRKQMAIQDAALITSNIALTAAVIKGNKARQQPKGDSARAKPVPDSVAKNTVPARTDTLTIHDTIPIMEGNVVFKQVETKHFDPVYFLTGSSTISKDDTRRLTTLAEEIRNHSEWRVEITGMTDASGTIAVNRRLSAARSGAVSNILLQNGVKDNQVIIRSKPAAANNIPDYDNPRRVVIRLLSSK